MKTILPADVVLFEGILVLYDQDVRELMHMKLFVDTDSDTRLARRGERSTCTDGEMLYHIIGVWVSV